ncbi:Vacuolar protein sorting-associated protein 74 [Mycena indigotica]|uniref:Vacuolar protein sorting-associated protein 74 n=1 Tax=Mycena indigotica TaxID=2126181 RepID=A0A8H6SFS1_9AGAR|nr:Vacuolar protein sorting-associated protein 74 [Mycena indigotica]KAF7297040.1 Vacuolar protein sorting-associated protein 74 [Mycena indigotica]
MASSGLSRRRAPATSTDRDEDRTQSTTPPLNNSSSENGTSTHAGSAFAGGSRVAFDPRDLVLEAGEDARVGGKLPRLTLMEEVLLLGIKDKQGYLSFWNDNISYALRGCILIELALRRRIGIVRDPGRKRLPLPDRLVTVLSTRQTGETLLDETLKMMKQTEDSGEKMGVGTWVDLLSGETWNVLKIGFQLKQVRERLAKGLVDKGVLRTEKTNFLLFDMATHPVADAHVKAGVVNRVVALLTSGTSAVPPQALDAEGTQCRTLRSVCLVCSAYTASVLDNAFGRLGYEEREAAFGRCDEILAEFAVWPFGGGTGGTESKRKNRIATGSGGVDVGRESVRGLVAAARTEAIGGDEDAGFELIAAVLEVLSKLDSLL